jgi:hypothetical protein
MYVLLAKIVQLGGGQIAIVFFGHSWSAFAIGIGQRQK